MHKKSNIVLRCGLVCGLVLSGAFGAQTQAQKAVKWKARHTYLMCVASEPSDLITCEANLRKTLLAKGVLETEIPGVINEAKQELETLQREQSIYKATKAKNISNLVMDYQHCINPCTTKHETDLKTCEDNQTKCEAALRKGLLPNVGLLSVIDNSQQLNLTDPAIDNIVNDIKNGSYTPSTSRSGSPQTSPTITPAPSAPSSPASIPLPQGGKVAVPASQSGRVLL